VSKENHKVVTQIKDYSWRF